MESPVDLRARFGRGEAEPSGEADGQPACAAQFRVRSFNFGQHWRTPEVREVGYRLDVPVAFVADLLDRNLPEYVADCIAHPDSTPLEAALRVQGWPDSRRILNDPSLRPLALEWFGLDCLSEWLGHGDPESAPGYVVNTIASVERRGGEVRFQGVARTAGRPVMYQDV